MNDKQIDELINKVLREDQTLPEGLSERLEQQIDAWAAAEKKETIRSIFPPPFSLLAQRSRCRSTVMHRHLPVYYPQ